MKATLSPAFVLHHTPFRETSLLLDVFTKQQGRCRLIAKGARKTGKKKVNHFQLYQPLLVSWSGYGELATVTAVEPEQAAYQLRQEKSLCGLYINELLVRMLPLHEAEPVLFQVYQQSLAALSSQQHTEITLRIFEKHLLEQLGYGLNLDYEAQSGKVFDADQLYYYQMGIGLIAWQNQQGVRVISGRSILHLKNEAGFDNASLQQIKHLMRDVIHYHLDGKPLKSRQLFADLQRYAVK